MSLLQVLRDLLPLVAILYAVEGFVWLRRHHLGLTGSLPRRSRLRRGPWIGISLPSPLGHCYRFQRREFLLCSRGVFVREGPADRPTSNYQRSGFALHSWDDLPRHLRVEGPTLILGGRRMSTPSVGHARELARTLLRLQRDDDGRREQIVSTLEFQLDRDRVEARISGFLRLTRSLRWIAGVYTLSLFAGGLAITRWEPNPTATRLGLLGLGLLYLALLLALDRARRRAREEGIVEARGVVAGAILSPPGAALAGVQLGRDLLRDFDPGAILSATAPAEDRQSWLAQELAGIALARTDAAGASDPAWAEAWDLREAGVARLVLASGDSTASLRQPPAESQANGTPFCPLCREVFSRQATRCPDCSLDLVQAMPRDDL